MSEVPLYFQHGRHACTPTEAVSEQDRRSQHSSGQGQETFVSW